MVRMLLVLPAFAVLAAASPACAREPTAGERATIREGLLDKLKDPESARIGKLSVGPTRDKPGVAVCGEVNARNSFGGYTGMQPFLGFMGPDRAGATKFYLFTIGNDADTSKYLVDKCRIEGAPL